MLRTFQPYDTLSFYICMFITDTLSAYMLLTWTIVEHLKLLAHTSRTPEKKKGDKHRGEIPEISKRMEDINRTHLVPKPQEIPIALCDLPSENLRSRYQTLDPKHVKKLYDSFRTNRTQISSWIVVVFGIFPDKFKLENYLHSQSKVCLACYVLFC